MNDVTAKLAEALRNLLAKNTRFSGGTWDAAREALRLYDAAKAQPKQAAEPVEAVLATRLAVAEEMAAQYAAQLDEVREQKDGAYLERNRCVALIARMALALGLKAGVAKTAIEGWSEDWHGCVYIDLPEGQASWHYHDSQASLFDGLPSYAGAWDGHSTPEKYARVAASYAAPVAQAEQWQPIETAPKDGSTIMLWEKYESEPFFGYWCDGRSRWRASTTHYDTDGNACVIDRIYSEDVSHWMPLPQPPKENNHD